MYSSYNGGPPEIKTHVKMPEKIKKYTGDGSGLRGGAGCYFTTKPRSIVLRRFRNPSKGWGRDLSLTTSLMCDRFLLSCGWFTDHPPRGHMFEIKAVLLGHFDVQTKVIHVTNLKGRKNSGEKYSVICKLPTWWNERRIIIWTTFK